MGLENLSEAKRLLIEKTGALMTGHFVLASGLHSAHYFQCALLCQYPKVMEEICGALAGRVPRAGEVETVLSPAIGGIVFGQEMARALGCRAIFAEKDEGGDMTLRRGFALDRGEKVLLAEDVTTTGGSILKTAALARERGAEVLGYVTIVDRSGGKFQPDAPLTSWAELSFETFSSDNLPDNLKVTPAVKPGSGRK